MVYFKGIRRNFKFSGKGSVHIMCSQASLYRGTPRTTLCQFPLRKVTCIQPSESILSKAATTSDFTISDNEHFYRAVESTRTLWNPPTNTGDDKSPWRMNFAWWRLIYDSSVRILLQVPPSWRLEF